MVLTQSFANGYFARRDSLRAHQHAAAIAASKRTPKTTIRAIHQALLEPEAGGGTGLSGEGDRGESGLVGELGDMGGEIGVTGDEGAIGDVGADGVPLLRWHTERPAKTDEH